MAQIIKSHEGNGHEAMLTLEDDLKTITVLFDGETFATGDGKKEVERLKFCWNLTQVMVDLSKPK